ncbi:cob(I)yrinic acid a,c-diamide adenosyltransferase [Deinococcus cellulosilyticus]|uniref:Corrinoid adenosyltransferase n=1 Tax=Deinococcus cellulosilyticus (strain DSM 18568 / NBRC 106333 / KACC 11606 / 5516J-15) TaxID=1223518 RepID=A0A511N529_DEIC1|nr:cob(I)yrinic acid a,c-diamide adenosyltransferase [Deinococcus cellulosilyticus]GEM47949.1 ATP--cob(I)alamin adenosyltransferase [Deinococcus cellulosilyticus NBRC 106333 = KACC 11606]
MKIYTRTGDQGETGLYGADRVSKGHPRVEAYGTVDELNSLLGLARAQSQDALLDEELAYLQNALFDVGADLATRADSPYAKNVNRMDAEDVAVLEGMIDRLETECEPLRNFIHPGGTVTAATLHVARNVARRAERDVVRLQQEEEVNPQVRVYLNRVSDLLFVMARAVNARSGLSETLWHVKGRK